MQAKVIKKFRDAETGEIRSVGDVIEITEKRFDTILAAGLYVERIEEEKKKSSKKKVAE